MFLRIVITCWHPWAPFGFSWRPWKSRTTQISVYYAFELGFVAERSNKNGCPKNGCPQKGAILTLRTAYKVAGVCVCVCVRLVYRREAATNDCYNTKVALEVLQSLIQHCLQSSRGHHQQQQKRPILIASNNVYTAEKCKRSHHLPATCGRLQPWSVMSFPGAYNLLSSSMSFEWLLNRSMRDPLRNDFALKSNWAQTNCARWGYEPAYMSGSLHFHDLSFGPCFPKISIWGQNF